MKKVINIIVSVGTIILCVLTIIKVIKKEDIAIDEPDMNFYD